MTDLNDNTLPHGWVKQFDPQSRLPFYVDTQANPPRSIWVHPFEDDLYLSEHPEAHRDAVNFNPPPPYSRRHSFNGQPSPPVTAVPPRATTPHKPGFFRRLKDKAVSSMEARERRRNAMYEQYTMNPTAYGRYAPPGSAYGQAQYTQMNSLGNMGSRGRYGNNYGMNGMAMPLMGGLAGGLLLGDMVSGGFGGFDGGGGDFGGGGGF